MPLAPDSTVHRPVFKLLKLSVKVTAVPPLGQVARSVRSAKDSASGDSRGDAGLLASMLGERIRTSETANTIIDATDLARMSDA